MFAEFQECLLALLCLSLYPSTLTNLPPTAWIFIIFYIRNLLNLLKVQVCLTQKVLGILRGGQYVSC